jgi:hypothetical protein
VMRREKKDNRDDEKYDYISPTQALLKFKSKNHPESIHPFTSLCEQKYLVMILV